MEPNSDLKHKLDDLTDIVSELTTRVYTHDHLLIPESKDKNYFRYVEKYHHIRGYENSKDLFGYITDLYGYIEYLIKRVERLESELTKINGTNGTSFPEIPRSESLDPRYWPVDTFKE